MTRDLVELIEAGVVDVDDVDDDVPFGFHVIEWWEANGTDADDACCDLCGDAAIECECWAAAADASLA